MKKSVLLIAVCLMTFTAVFASNTTDAPESGFSILKNGSIVHLLYKSSTPSNVRVTIIDEKNNLVYTEVLKRMDGFNRPYNMNTLPPGKYTFEVEDYTGITRKVVMIDGKKNEMALHVERVHGTEGKILVMAGKSSKGFTMHFEDKYGRKLYTERKILDGDFASVYNFSKVKGEVSVFITDFHGNEMKIDF